LIFICTTTLLKTIEHKNGVNAVNFLPDNKSLLTASYDGQLAVLNLETQETTFHKLYDANFNSIVWDKKGETFLTTSDNQAYLWNANELLKKGNKIPLLTYPENPNTTIFWAGLSPNGQFSALAARDFAIQLYSNTNPPTLKKIFYGHKQTVKKVIFSPDSKQLASVAGDNTLKVWDLIQETELFSLTLPSQSQGTENSIYDFDFRCWEKEKEPFCWIAIPLPEEQQIIAYHFKL